MVNRMSYFISFEYLVCTKPSKNIRRYIGCVLEAPNLAIVTEPLGVCFRWRFGGGSGVVTELDACIWPGFLQAWGLGLSVKAT